MMANSHDGSRLPTRAFILSTNRSLKTKNTP